jgi:BolA protein
MEERILKKIKEALNDISRIYVINESHLHAGHREGGGTETHFKVEIKSDDFNDKSRIDSHKVINNILKDEFDNNGLHALSIKIIK